MKKVLYMTQYPNDGTAFYRLSPLEYINGKDIQITYKQMNGHIGWEWFTSYDILILSRPSSHNDLSIIKLAKDCGLKVISDFDDDCLHVDQYNPTYGIYEACKGLILECLMLCDEIWVTTRGLKKSFSMYNSNIHIIPNCHNDYLFPVDQKKDFNLNTKKAFWRGGTSHQADVYEVAEQLVKTINDNQDWQFQFIGDRFIFMEQRCANNYQPVSQMSLIQYFKYLHKENPNIMFAPLCNTVFNQSKSNISWIESSYSGAAFFGHGKSIEFNKPGIADFEHLHEEFGQSDMETLKEANECSWEYILNNLLLSNVNELRKQRLLS